MQLNAFSFPVREDIQMVYNTGDGSALVVKDLKASPKSPPEYHIFSKQPAQKDKELSSKEKDKNKTLASAKAFRKSQ